MRACGIRTDHEGLGDRAVLRAGREEFKDFSFARRQPRDAKECLPFTKPALTECGEQGAQHRGWDERLSLMDEARSFQQLTEPDVLRDESRDTRFDRGQQL